MLDVTAVTHFQTKQDMSRWTRAHADSAGITWSVQAGPDGTMFVIEHAQDRSTLARTDDQPALAAAAPEP